MKFATLEGQRVAVWGYGREGHAALEALRRRLPGQPLTLFCHRAEMAGDVIEGIDVRTDPPDSDALAAFDYVIKSPGISIYKPEIIAARERGTVFTSGTALWFGENPDARVVGITGTKGKSTTSALLAHLARALGIRTALAGNIGLPLLELDDEHADLWVLELSSFQTGDAGPLELGIVTSLYEEHLDWHGSRERYVADKLKLADASRTLLVNATQPLLLERTAAHPCRRLFGHPDGWHIRAVTDAGNITAGAAPHPRHSGESRNPFASSREATMDSGLRRNDDVGASAHAVIQRGDATVMPLSALPMPGYHNGLNACAALTALDLLGFDASRAVPALAHFQPLPHRLQPLGERDGVQWINDSISTTPQAALAALESLGDRSVTLILGGHDRGLDWSGFAQHIGLWPGTLRIITQGANGPRIAHALRAANVATPVREVEHFDDAVAWARQITAQGGVIVLSPGAPSFDQFRDYTERGRRFAELGGFDVVALGRVSGLGIA